jgi:hypothetical protein
MKNSNKLIHIDAMMAWRGNGNTGTISLDTGNRWSLMVIVMSGRE